MSPTFAVAPIWDDEALNAARLEGIAAFIKERAGEGARKYGTAFADALRLTEMLFSATHDLLTFESGEALSNNPALLNVARYLAGPPVSGDDLDTLASTRLSGRRNMDAALARLAAETLASTLDRERFPWVAAGRKPSAPEREAALRWTAGLQAAQRVQVSRRSESSSRQEDAVEALLIQRQFRKVPRRPITIVGGLAPGEFCREAAVVGVKCDVPVGLLDGRFLLIECKVSNSAVNSVKRLNRETVGKARQWRQAFGDRAIPAAVLAGVFKLPNLTDAQNAGVALFWEHDLEPLASFLSDAAN